jgi:hypothetical protein
MASIAPFIIQHLQFQSKNIFPSAMIGKKDSDKIDRVYFLLHDTGLTSTFMQHIPL